MDSQDDVEEKVGRGRRSLRDGSEDGSDIPVAVAIDAEDVTIIDRTEPRMAIFSICQGEDVHGQSGAQNRSGSETSVRNTTVAELRDKIATLSCSSGRQN